MTLVAALIACFAVAIMLICLWSLLRPQWLFNLAAEVLDQPWLLPLAVFRSATK